MLGPLTANQLATCLASELPVPTNGITPALKGCRRNSPQAFHPLERSSFWSIFTIQGTHTGLAKVAVQCSADTFPAEAGQVVVNQTLVLRINPDSYLDGENRHLRQVRNRYPQVEKTRKFCKSRLKN
jgi:hypothetical protein